MSHRHGLYYTKLEEKYGERLKTPNGCLDILDELLEHGDENTPLSSSFEQVDRHYQRLMAKAKKRGEDVSRHKKRYYDLVAKMDEQIGSKEIAARIPDEGNPSNKPSPSPRQNLVHVCLGNEERGRIENEY